LEDEFKNLATRGMISDPEMNRAFGGPDSGRDFEARLAHLKAASEK